MIHTVLIANRGEIASRIIRTCRRLGIRTVAVYSDADQNAPFAGEADRAVHIGASEPAASYLDQQKLIETAKKMGANAIHPGYGFLSENAAFARLCAEHELIFIGPNPEAIEAMGSKSRAKALMKEHNVPTIPGYQGADQSVETLRQAALDMGFPVLLKATAGGGGKGMRIVRKAEELDGAIEAARREASNAFGDDELIIEKYIESGRHIEFQIFGDQHGNAIHLLERECTIQRRYQKVIEESPSPVLDDAKRQEMGAAAVQAAKALNYDNAGTVEFIFDDTTRDFYFLEVNTRLQVEHPVTELITGLDLVQLQIESAEGKPLRMQQDAVQGDGYAVECRLYAEDPENGFLPVTGRVERFSAPEVEGLRIDAAVQSGSDISIFYDPMIAKIIVHGAHRETVLRKMQFVMANLVCLGTTTNQAFLHSILKNPDFIAGKYDTHFIENTYPEGYQTQRSEAALDHLLIAATLRAWQERHQQRKLLRSLPSGWRNSFTQHQQTKFQFQELEHLVEYRKREQEFEIKISDRVYQAHFVAMDEQYIDLRIEGIRYSFAYADTPAVAFKEAPKIHIQHPDFGSVSLTIPPRFPEKEGQTVAGGYESPMPSQIVKILVETGQAVEVGTPLIVLSSMKMENTIVADEAGTVQEIFTSEGENVEAGFLLLQINPKTA
ncbi:MAG: biotin carboxylase N-terminal domain-containing protein [Bacteroidota bacterium]